MEDEIMYNKDELPIATHTGTLVFDGIRVSCANLPNKIRVLSESGIAGAITGRNGGASTWQRHVREYSRETPYFLQSKQLKPFVEHSLDAARFPPIFYVRGSRQIIKAYDATILPTICHIWMAARKAGALPEKDWAKAERAEELLLAIAKTGIIALVDEATGYQADRDHQELQVLLSKYLSDYQLDWARVFDPEFYSEMFRLWGWSFHAGSNARPRLAGKITADIVYSRIHPNILKELRERNPVVNHASYRRQAAHHQFLSGEVGRPHLLSRVTSLKALMKASETKEEFMKLVNRAFPKFHTVDIQAPTL